MNLSSLRNLDKDDVLGSVGLQTKSSVSAALAGTLATFGVGVLVGAGLGLLLAPKSGPALREDIRHRLRGAPDDIKEVLSSAKSKLEATPAV